MKVEKKIFGQSAPFDVPAGQALLQKTFFWAVNFAALLFVFSYLVVGDSALFDGWTLIIFLLQLLCLQLGLKLLSANAARVFLIIYYFVTLVYVIPRLYQYLIVPHGLTIAYGSGTSINNTQVVAAMVNKALTYQLVGLLVFIVAAAWISGGRHQSDGARPPYGFDRVGFFSSLAALLFTIVARLDEIHYWLYDGWRGWLPISFQEFHALIEIVFNADMVFLVGFLMCFSKSEGLRRDALGVFLLSAVYVAFKIGSGSRAGPLFVVVAIFLALLLDLGATSFSARRITLLIVMMAVLSVVGFSVATKIRNTELPKSNISFDSTASDVQRAGRASFTFPRGDAGTHGQAPSSINSAPLIAPIGIMDRLGAYLDSLVVVLNFEGRADLLARYMRPEYSLKSAVNIIVPGVVFDCCTINTTFLPPFVYGGREELLLYRSGYYESTIWTVFGLAQVMFGRLGGLGVLLVCGVVFGAVYVQLRASRWGVVLMPIFLFYGVYMFFMMQGLDAFFVDIQKFGLSMLVGFGLTYAFSRVGRVALRLRSRA